MAELGIDVVLLSVGPDLPYLTGYEAMPLERLTMLVLPRDVRRHARGARAGGAPGGRAARRLHRAAVGRDRGSDRHRGRARRARPARWPSATARGPASWSTCSTRFPPPVGAGPAQSSGPLRARKDAAEIAALRRPARPLIEWPPPCRRARSRSSGRTEAEVSAELGRRLLAEGHHRVNFAIVAAGRQRGQPAPRAGRPGDRGRRGRALRLRRHDADATAWATAPTSPAASHLGEPPAEVAEAYAVLLDAQQAAVRGRHGRHAVRGGRRRRPPGHHRGRLRRALHPPHRARHRHRGARGPLHRVGQRRRRSSAGHAFSIEPGIYVPGRFGFRLEDIVVAADAGPDPLNRADHDLASL